MMVVGRSLKQVEVVDRLNGKGERLGCLVDASDKVSVKIGQRADQRRILRGCLQLTA
jgi:hypothetical protein